MRFKYLILSISCLMLIAGNASGETTLKDIFTIKDKLPLTTPVTNDSLTTDLRLKMAEKPETIQALLQSIINNVIKGLKRTNPIFASHGTQIKKETLTNFIKIMTDIIKSKNAKNPENNLLTPDLLKVKIEATIGPGAAKPGSKDDGPDKPISVSLTLQDWINFLQYYNDKHEKLPTTKYYSLNPVKIYNEEDEVKKEAEKQLEEDRAKREKAKKEQEEQEAKAKAKEDAEQKQKAAGEQAAKEKKEAEAAKKIQTMYRGHAARKNYLEQKKAKAEEDRKAKEAQEAKEKADKAENLNQKLTALKQNIVTLKAKLKILSEKLGTLKQHLLAKK